MPSNVVETTATPPLSNKAKKRLLRDQLRLQEASKTNTIMTDKAFTDINEISENSMKALGEVLGFTKMTTIQALSIPPALSGKDILGKSKTGTG